MKKVLLVPLKSIFEVNRPDPAGPGPTMTLFDALYLRTYCRYELQILTHISHTFLSIIVKMVAILVNIDFRTTFDIFSLITQQLLRFSDLSLFHVKER